MQEVQTFKQTNGELLQNIAQLD